MKLLSGKEVIAKLYQEDDAEKIVNLIIRNFKEVNIYEYKNGIKELDDEQHYRLEKFRKPDENLRR